MKKTLIILTIIFGTSLSFAGQGKGSCKSFAEKVAMSLFSLESSVSDLNGATTSVRLLNTATGQSSTQWQVAFSGSDGTSDSEWGKIYKVDVTNYSDNEVEACYLDAVKVIKAG